MARPMPPPSCARKSSTPTVTASRSIAVRSCTPQSQRRLPSRSPVRQEECSRTGDLLGSLRCDCGEQLRTAIDRLAVTDGVLLYLAQEGRGIRCVKLLTNNPRKIEALRRAGIDVVDRVGLTATTNRHNERYVAAKREQAGHYG